MYKPSFSGDTPQAQAAPEVLAIATKSQATSYKPHPVWRLTVRCPHCQHVHTHGGGTGDAPAYGHRVAHCHGGTRGGYVLVEVAA